MRKMKVSYFKIINWKETPSNPAFETMQYATNPEFLDFDISINKKLVKFQIYSPLKCAIQTWN